MVEQAWRIQPVRSQADLQAAARLFEVYAASLGIDLGFQGFAAELAGLPGKHAPPEGELLLARDQAGKALGCVGLRPLEPGVCCEMKRLYVSPAGRGRGLGQALIAAIIGEAERIGYQEIRLDTLPTMTEAAALYRKAGFAPIAPYYASPVAGTMFFSRGCAMEGPFRARHREIGIMASITETAAAFFAACETGKGWEGCSRYCTPEATFAAQAEPLADVKSLQRYCDWMQGLLTVLTDGSYEIKSFATDTERQSVCAYGIFTGTHLAGGPCAPTGKTTKTDYVYVMQFEDGKIAHMTKIWHSGLALKELGWA